MNERIKTLAEQATVTRGRMRVVDIEKFAELIVRECAKIVEDSEGYSQYFPHVTESIEKHFGVKP